MLGHFCLLLLKPGYSWNWPTYSNLHKNLKRIFSFTMIPQVIYKVWHSKSICSMSRKVVMTFHFSCTILDHETSYNAVENQLTVIEICFFFVFIPVSFSIKLKLNHFPVLQCKTFRVICTKVSIENKKK